MSLFWNPDLQNLSPYVPGEQPKHEKLVKLNTNESPYGPSPKALAAIAAGNHEGLRLYPDPDAKALKEAIAKHYGLKPNQVFVGNGSDEVLAHVFLGLLKHQSHSSFPISPTASIPSIANSLELTTKRLRSIVNLPFISMIMF